MKDDVCPSGACQMTTDAWTREHLLPVGLTEGWRYGFMAGQTCSNQKSALDAVAIPIRKICSVPAIFVYPPMPNPGAMAVEERGKSRCRRILRSDSPLVSPS